MYSINDAVNPNTMERRTCATINGTWSAPETVTVYLSSGSLWHLDVILSGGVYYALINVDAASLWYAHSSNGRTWAVPSPALIAQSGSDIWDKLLYRGTLVKTATGFDMWYSARNAANEWRIGYTPVTVA
jgi:hypothetical protein